MEKRVYKLEDFCIPLGKWYAFCVTTDVDGDTVTVWIEADVDPKEPIVADDPMILF